MHLSQMVGNSDYFWFWGPSPRLPGKGSPGRCPGLPPTRIRKVSFRPQSLTAWLPGRPYMSVPMKSQSLPHFVDRSCNWRRLEIDPKAIITCFQGLRRLIKRVPGSSLSILHSTRIGHCLPRVFPGHLQIGGGRFLICLTSFFIHLFPPAYPLQIFCFNFRVP